MSVIPSKAQRLNKKLSAILTGNSVILDTETTGLAGNSEIVEVSVINMQGEVLFDTLVRPKTKMRADNRAIAVHGITNEMLSEAPQWNEIHEQFCDLIRDKTVVIYNAAFDHRLLTQTAHQYGLTLPELRTECAMQLYSTWQGTLSHSRRVRGYKLSTAAATLQVDLIGHAHRALADCRTTLGVLEAMHNLHTDITN